MRTRLITATAILLASAPAHAALKVGSDSYLFYRPDPASGVEAIRLAGLADIAAVTAADFI